MRQQKILQLASAILEGGPARHAHDDAVLAYVSTCRYQLLFFFSFSPFFARDAAMKMEKRGTEEGTLKIENTV